MRLKTKTFTMAVLDRNGISIAQQTAGAANLTITGALATAGVATMDVPRHVAVYSAGNIATVVFTVTGTDRFGAAITETITGVNGTTVNGSKNFATVTQVAASAIVGTNVEVGTTNRADTALYPVNYHGGELSYLVELSASASLTWAMEYTTRNVLAPGFLEDSIAYQTDLTGQTGDNDNSTDGPLTAMRLAITAWTSASDTVTYTFNQRSH